MLVEVQISVNFIYFVYLEIRTIYLKLQEEVIFDWRKISWALLVTLLVGLKRDVYSIRD